MKKSGGRVEVTRPWHLVLAPTVPVLALVAPNVSELSPRGALWPAVLGIAAVLLIWSALAWLAPDRRAAALSITILAIVTLGWANVTRLALLLHISPALLYLIVVVICIGLLWASRIAIAATTFANVLLAAMVVAFLIQIAWSELRRDRILPPPLTTAAAATGQHPDIYLLVLDGYGRSDVLRDLYGFGNDLATSLREMGFFVADQAHSNYSQTTQSIASSLNLDYLEPLLAGVPLEKRNRRAVADLINHNRMFQTLSAAGYRIESYDSEYDLIRPTADLTHGPWFQATHFAFSYYEGTAVPVLLGMLGLPPSQLSLHAHRRNVRWVIDRLDTDRNDATTPTLVFAHLLVPHPPFVFNADGSDRPTNLAGAIWDGDHWQLAAEGRGESYTVGYVDAVRFLNNRLVALTRRLVNRSRPTIVYIFGDHGPGSRLKWEDPAATDMRERLGIVMAIRFPAGDYSMLHPRVTPVNASRAVLNDALGTTLPTLDDRSFFSTWSQPFNFVDVTDRLASAR